MGHTPYGYRIENGIAVVDEDAAGKLRRLYTNYLSSMSLKTAAAEAGIRPASSTSSRQRTSTCAFSQISINSINCPQFLAIIAARTETTTSISSCEISCFRRLNSFLSGSAPEASSK